MKAITMHQPWATLVAVGEKHIETRSWSTDYRGPLAIHAAKTMPAYALDAAFSFSDVLRSHGYTTRTRLKSYKTWNGEAWLPSGAIVAVCELVDIVQIDEFSERHGSIKFDFDKEKLFLDEKHPISNNVVKGSWQYIFYASVGIYGRLYVNDALMDVVIRIPPPEPELSYGDYTPGRYAWILSNVQKLPEPILARGYQGLWDVEWEQS